MSVELIKMVTIKEDGVYLTSHSQNDDCPFLAWKCDSLSKIYAEEGEKGLDREIICMLYEYAQLAENNDTTAKYAYAINHKKSRQIYARYIAKINKIYDNMGENDKNSIWMNPTENAKKYIQEKAHMENEMYSEIAELCTEYGGKQFRAE